MTDAQHTKKYVVVYSGGAYIVAFVSVQGQLVGMCEHASPESARAECLRLSKLAKVAAFLKAATAPAQGARFARPLRWFPPDEFA